MSLDPLLEDKLRTIETRYNELNNQLADPEIAADSKRFQKLAKSHSDYGTIVSKYQDYRGVVSSLADTRAILREPDLDPEMKAMTEEELVTLEGKLVQFEGELKVLLLPKDPNDERNVIMEIRAGTGGDEAGLFAADIFRMYSRYAERQGWRMEIMSSSPTGVGGFKEII